MVLLNARLGRAERLPKEVREKYGLPDKGMVVIESLSQSSDVSVSDPTSEPSQIASEDAQTPSAKVALSDSLDNSEETSGKSMKNALVGNSCSESTTGFSQCIVCESMGKICDCGIYRVTVRRGGV